MTDQVYREEFPMSLLANYGEEGISIHAEKVARQKAAQQGMRLGRIKREWWRYYRFLQGVASCEPAKVLCDSSEAEIVVIFLAFDAHPMVDVVEFL